VSERNVRLGSTLITFYNNAYWGLPADAGPGAFVEAVEKDARPYFDRMLDGMVEAGVEGIELAPRPGGWEGALLAYETVDGVAEALSSRGLSLGSSYQQGRQLIGSVLDGSMTADEADAYTRRHAEFVAALGADIIVMGTVARAPFSDGDFDAAVPDDAMRTVAEQVNRLAAAAWESGVRIALHTDAYSVCSRNEDIARMLELTDPTSVQLCLDAGHTTLDGGDAVAALAASVGRVPVMHWKDCIAPLHGSVPLGQPDPHGIMMRNFRIFGDGIIDWHAWQHVLADAHWRGWAMAENDMAPDPIAEIRKGLEYYRAELEDIYR
jgi:inosose dehydratase